MSRLTAREKDLVAASIPCFGGASTRDEVRAAKIKAQGHYWHDEDYMQFCSVSIKGKKKFFEYCHSPKDPDYKDCGCSNEGCDFNFYNAKKAARLWTKYICG